MRGLSLSENDKYESLAFMADVIGETLGGAVTIEDAGNRLLAYSSHELQTDPARLATIIKRRVPDHVINSLWRNGLMQRLQQSDEPLLISGIEEVGLGNRVAIAIRKNEEVLGYIWVQVDRPLNDQAIEWLKQMAQTLKPKLLHTRQRLLVEDGQEFLWQMLTGHFKAHSQIVERARSLQLSLPASMSVLVYEFAEPLSDLFRRQIQKWVISVRKYVEGHVADRNQLVLLLSTADYEMNNLEISEFTNEFIQRADLKLPVNSLICGSGGSVRDDFTKLEASYQEALSVLQIKKQFPEETQNLYYYHELGWYQYLPAILNVRRSKRIENPHIQKLRGYDRKHQTELLKTLDVYLSCDSNVKESAKALHIHINTLTYRLARISEITNLNLRDMNQKVTLYLDLRTENNRT